MMATVTTWVGPALDAAVLVLLGVLVWRLGRDPGAEWSERETRLRAIFDDLRALVAQSEGLARDLDERLAGRETRLRALLGEAHEALGGVEPGSARSARGPARGPVRGAVGPSAPAAATAAASSPPAPAAPAVPASADTEETAERIERLAEAGTAVEEIARRVGVAPAEVRLVIGLKAARAARRRAATGEAHAHA